MRLAHQELLENLMNITWTSPWFWVIACAVAAWLTSFDLVAIRAGNRWGRKKGLLVWVLSVPTALLLGLYFVTFATVWAIFLSAAVSYVLHRRRAAHRRYGYDFE